MDKHSENGAEPETAKVVNFEDALLGACPPEARARVLAEAALLAEAFAPEGRSEQLTAMAEALTTDARDPDMDREHARRLAAALRRLARQADD